jgi:putative addiction module component (TIGR02574 family)
MDDFLKPALKLRRAQRAKLAQALLASLDGKEDADARAAWETELRKRIRDIRAGRVSLVPWDKIRTEIAQGLRSR